MFTSMKGSVIYLSISFPGSSNNASAFRVFLKSSLESQTHFTFVWGWEKEPGNIVSMDLCSHPVKISG